MTYGPVAENAFAIARRKAVKGHKDQIVWQDKDGALHTDLFTVEAAKRALLATGTQRHFWRISANSGVGTIVRWRFGLRMLRNCLRGLDGPRVSA